MDSAGAALIIGFAIGLSGAPAPGPTLIATIRGPLRERWMAGPKISAGHAAIEQSSCVQLLRAWQRQEHFCSGCPCRGAVLIVLGLLAVKRSRNAGISAEMAVPAGNPYVAGVVTSGANPYFRLWWFTVGSSLILEALSSPGRLSSLHSWPETGLLILDGSALVPLGVPGEGYPLCHAVSHNPCRMWDFAHHFLSILSP